MKQVIAVFTFLIAAGTLSAQCGSESLFQEKFNFGGTIRMHLEAGAYTIRPTDSPNIVVTCHTRSEKRVKVEIRAHASTAEVFVRDTPNNDFSATIEVPRRSDLWVRLSAGELKVGAVEGDKNLEIRAGQMEVNIPHPEEYGHRDASVFTGSLEAPAFHVSKGGLFRSFEQNGTGRYSLHAHVMSGEIDLRDQNKQDQI